MKFSIYLNRHVFVMVCLFVCLFVFVCLFCGDIYVLIENVPNPELWFVHIIRISEDVGNISRSSILDTVVCGNCLIFSGVVLSNLHVVDLSSSRNLAIIGISIFTGMMVPHWIETYPTELDTGL